MLQLTQCPLCSEQNLKHFLTTSDYTTSKESFQIMQCHHCGFLFTNPRPTGQALSQYYQSADYISHTDSKTGILSQTYQLARTYALKRKTSLIANFHQNPKILDYGCGTGDFLHACQKKGWPIEGIEPSPAARKKAIQKTGINIAEALTMETPKYYDVITLWHVLEHLEDPVQTLRQLSTFLAPSGSFIIAVPNCQSPDAIHYKDFWAAYDVPRHLWHFSKNTMQLLLSQIPLQIVSIKPMNLDAYYISLLSEKYKTSDSSITAANILKGAWHGFLSNLRAKKTVNHSSLIYIVTK